MSTTETNKPNFEKPYVVSIKEFDEKARESVYTNAKGEQKTQTFINFYKQGNREISWILKYSKSQLKEKYPNKFDDEKLSISIVSDNDYQIVQKTGDKKEFKSVKGHELKQLMNYYIFIDLKDAKITDLLDENGLPKNKLSVSKNGVSFIVDANWIKENDKGLYISVRHKNTVRLSTPGQDGWNHKDVTWAYVKTVINPEEKSVNDIIKESDKKSKETEQPSKKKKQNEMEH